MATVTLDKDNFDQTMSDSPMVVVDFWAPWCAPCRSFGPVFEAASDKHADIVFGKVNTEEQPELAGGFGIRSIPTLMILREKIILYSEAGAPSAGQLDAILEQAKALDMEAVHRELAEQHANEGNGADKGNGADRSQG
jgi:thioredoxin